MGDDQATVDYFENHVHDYSAGRLHSAVTFITEHITPDASLIDIGCGTGSVLAHIAGTTGISQLAGLDVSARCVELTKEKVTADVYRASVLDDATVDRFRGGFDFAVMAAVLHHLVGEPPALAPRSEPCGGECARAGEARRVPDRHGADLCPRGANLRSLLGQDGALEDLSPTAAGRRLLEQHRGAGGVVLQQ